MEYSSFSFGWPAVKVMVKGLLTPGLRGELASISRSNNPCPGASGIEPARPRDGPAKSESVMQEKEVR